MLRPVRGYRLAIAARYWRAAHLIKCNQIRDAEFMDPVGHLLCMSGEIALKSFLSGAGYSDKKLRNKIGHDLEKCIWHAIREGLAVDDNNVSCLLTMRSIHLDNFYRYGVAANLDGSVKTGAFMLVDEDQALAEVAKIIDRVAGNGSLLRTRHQSDTPINWPPTETLLKPVSLKRLALIKTEVKKRQDEIKSLNERIRRSQSG